MPLYKYKSFAEAEQHLKKLQARDPLQRLSDLQDLVYALKPPGKVQHGVMKFTSWGEAEHHRLQTTG